MAGKQPRRPGQGGQPGRVIKADDPKFQHGVLIGKHKHELAGHHQLGQVEHRHNNDNVHNKDDWDRNADGNNALSDRAALLGSFRADRRMGGGPAAAKAQADLTRGISNREHGFGEGL